MDISDSLFERTSFQLECSLNMTKVELELISDAVKQWKT